MSNMEIVLLSPILCVPRSASSDLFMTVREKETKNDENVESGL